MTTPLNNPGDDDRAISLLAQDQYLRVVAWIQALEPMLPQEEEQVLQTLLRAKREPDNSWVAMRLKHARTRLVEAFQPLVISLAKRAASRFHSMDELDLVQEGNLGLLAAIDEYDERTHASTRFAVVAAVRIRRALWIALYERDGNTRLPGHIANLYSKVQRLSVQFKQREDREPSVQELAAMVGAPEDRIQEACLFASRRYGLSLQQISRFFEEEDAEERYGFVSLFQAEVQAETKQQGQLQEVFRYLFEHELTPEERHVIEVRYGFHDGVSSCRSPLLVGEMLGKSSDCVVSLDKSARRRMVRVLEPVLFPEQGLEPVQMIQDDYYTISEVCSLLKVCSTTIDTYARCGRLPVLRGKRRYRGQMVSRLFPKAAVDALACERVEKVSA